MATLESKDDPGSPPGRPLDHRMISEGVASVMRTTATLLGAAAVILFLLLAVDDGVPQSADFESWQAPAQYIFLLYVIAGYLLALRWNGVGGAMMVTGAVGLGVLASVEYEPLASLVACVVFFVPGLLFLLSWQRTRSLASIAVLGAAMVVLLAAGGYASDRVYSYYWGPTHPESATAPLESELIEWVWVGGTTSDGTTVKLKLRTTDERVSLLVSDDPSLSEPVSFESEAVVDRVVQFSLTGLQPETKYYYAPVLSGQPSLSVGSFSTFPAGPASFTIAVGSCARTGSNGEVYDTIRGHDPLLFAITGDWHYSNIDTNDPDAFRAAYDETLTRPAQSALYRSASISYTWDDHDYGGNNASATSASRPAARQTYDEMTPHYPLAAGDGGAIYQAFSIGRVRFIMTDGRSERSPSSTPDGPDKTMLGAAQESWLLDELLQARDTSALIVWINGVPWIDPAGDGKDTWGGYASERERIANFIADNEITNVVMLSGDAHMVAIDDGTNSGFSSEGDASFPVMHAAALDKRGSVKGGPYSEGTFPDGGQFGLMTVEDEGGNAIKVTLSGRNYKDEELVRYEFTVATPVASVSTP